MLDIHIILIDLPVGSWSGYWSGWGWGEGGLKRTR